MKRVLFKTSAILVSVSMLLSVAACSKTTDTQGKDNGSDTVTTVKEEPKVTFQIYKNAGALGLPEDGGEGKKLLIEGAAKVGIKDVDYSLSLASGTAYWDKLGIMTAANEVPDLFDINPLNMRKYAEGNNLLDLSEYVKKMPNYQKFHPKEADTALKLNGKLVALSACQRSEPFNGNATAGLIIRQDWLDNLGLKMPETTDQLYDVLKAFTDKDPDGNGKKDTFGIGTGKGGAGNGILGNIMGAYGIAPQAWVKKDGKLVKAFTLPEMKQALTLIQKWYQEGLIEKDFMTIAGKDLNGKMAASKYGLLADNAFWVDPYSADLKNLLSSTPTAKVVMLESPKGPEGKRGTYGGNPATGLVSISANTKAPERLTRFLDWIVDSSYPNGGELLVTFGKEGVHYSFDEKANKITQLSTDVDKLAFGFGNPVRFLSTTDRRWMGPEGLEAASISNKWVIKSEFYGSVPAEVDYSADLNKLFDDYYYRIIAGSLPAAAWDEFVKKWYDQGGKDVEQQVNEEYNKGAK